MYMMYKSCDVCDAVCSVFVHTMQRSCKHQSVLYIQEWAEKTMERKVVQNMEVPYLPLIHML